MTQKQLADQLERDQSWVSKIESGKSRITDVDELRKLSELLDMPSEEFGLTPNPGDDQRSPVDRQIAESQSEWRVTRSWLNTHRCKLSVDAADLYDGLPSIGSSPILTQPGWLLQRPVELSNVELLWRAEANPPMLNGSEWQSATARPLNSRGERYDRYSRAVRDIARPTLFDNRMSFRLLGLDFDAQRPRMEFGHTTYFEMVDVCEVLAHEIAGVQMRATATDRRSRPALADLPFRQLIGDPFNLARRALQPSIDCLTLRKEDGNVSFVLHDRGGSQVAVAGGLYHIMPAGVFQPSSIAPWDQHNDFDLWRNMMREYGEEFLGDAEADGSSGQPIDYDNTEPFRSLNEGRRAGKIRPWFFGVGLDPLTLHGEILVVTVFDADLYDRVFAGMVTRNAEGALVSTEARVQDGLPFTEPVVSRLLAHEPLAPAASACLELAWEHRAELLA